MNHPDTAGFAVGLVPVNLLAESSPGFVWRLQTDEGDATSISVFPNSLTIVNLMCGPASDAVENERTRP